MLSTHTAYVKGLTLGMYVHVKVHIMPLYFQNAVTPQHRTSVCDNQLVAIHTGTTYVHTYAHSTCTTGVHVHVLHINCTVHNITNSTDIKHNYELRKYGNYIIHVHVHLYGIATIYMTN